MNTYLGAILFFNCDQGFGVIYDIRGESHPFFRGALVPELNPYELRCGALVDFDAETVSDRIKIKRVSLAAIEEINDEDAIALQSYVDEREWHDAQRRITSFKSMPDKDSRHHRNQT